MRTTMRGLTIALSLMACAPTGAAAADGRYAAVNGLKLYYEIHGTGRPLVLLHGGLSNIDASFGPLLPTLAASRQVIAIELQGHGHTADIDRPIRINQLADDVASLLGQLSIQQADVFGYSFGGMVALATAIRHPTMVNHLIVIGTPNNINGFEPAIREAIPASTAENTPPALKAAYAKIAPDPTQLPAVVAKVTKALTDFPGWRPDELHSIRAHVLVIVGDHDFVRPEHAVELFRQIPQSELLILPDAGHDAIEKHSQQVLAAVRPFLDAS